MFFGGLTFKEYMKTRIRKNWRFNNRSNKVAPMLPVLTTNNRTLMQDDTIVEYGPNEETIMQVMTRDGSIDFVGEDPSCEDEDPSCEVALPKTPGTL